MSGDGAVPQTVRGERDSSLTTRGSSAQSRISNALALGLMLLLGLGGLTWYYVNALMRQDRAKAATQSAASKRAQGDLPLPSLGRIAVPGAVADEHPVPPPDLLVAAQVLPEIPLAPSPSNASNVAPAPKSPEQLALERRLAGAVFSLHSAESPPAAASDGYNSPNARAAEPPPSELSGLLKPAATPSVRAAVLATQRLLLPKGAFIDCTLETAIDSTLPGMTTCVTATDTFGVDGQVVLLERGTKLIGETRGQLQQGAARIFVLWTEARTPTGVVVPLDSPGADELGRSGLPGEVDRHFWQRFGAAMLVSVIEGAVQAAVQSSRGSSGSVVVNPSASQDVLTEILKNTISIAPTVRKRNGDRIQVLVARDVDFRSVYELRSADGR